MNNFSSCFMDLAMYHKDINAHIRKILNDNYSWCTHIPLELKADEKDENSFIISRNGDIIHYFWVDIETEAPLTKNLAHNLFESIDIISENGVLIWHVDNIVLDFLMNFMETGKRIAYEQVINNKNNLTLVLPFKTKLPIYTVSVYDNFKLKFKLKTNYKTKLRPWANYEVVSGDKRMRLQTERFSTIIDKYETLIFPLEQTESNTYTFPFKPSGCVKFILFAVREKGENSVYLKNVIKNFSIFYEKYCRLNCNINFTSFVEPLFHSNSIGPEEIHMYAYCAGNLGEVNSNSNTDFRLLKDNEPVINITISENYKNCELVVVTVSNSLLQTEAGQSKIIY